MSEQQEPIAMLGGIIAALVEQGWKPSDIPVQAVPEGFALVPLKPTPAMIEAGCENNPTQWNDGTDDGFTSDVANDVYVAMVRVGSLVSSTQCEGK